MNQKSFTGRLAQASHGLSLLALLTLLVTSAVPAANAAPRAAGANPPAFIAAQANIDDPATTFSNHLYIPFVTSTANTVVIDAPDDFPHNPAPENGNEGVVIAAAIQVTATALVARSDTSTLRNPGDSLPLPSPGPSYGKPNQSRIWYNGYRNRWDALIPKNDSATAPPYIGSEDDHYIVKDIPGSQTFTNVELEDRDFGRPDAFWDNSNRKLYVLSSHPTQSRFWRLAYNESTDTYSFEVGTAGAGGVTVPGITHPNDNLGDNSPATLYVTPNNQVWVAVMKGGSGLQVQRSSDGGATWLTAPIALAPTARVGATTWIDFASGGQNYIGLFVGENGVPGSTTRFYFHYINQTADPTVLANWVNDSAGLGPVGIEQADDHVSAARDAAGNIYFGVKTESGGPTDPLIKLFRRTPAGVWSQYKVTETQEVPEQSRPSLVIDNQNNQLYIYMNGAEVVSNSVRVGTYKKAIELNTLSSLADAPVVDLFSRSNTVFSDIITPRQSVNATSDIVVLAHNRTNKTIWYGAQPIVPGAVIVPDVVGLTQTAAQQALIAEGLTVGTVTQENSATVPAGSVISQSPAAGNTVAPNSAVDLVVSTGPGQTAVPDVVGLTQMAAQQAIIDVGLTVGTITQQNSATVPAGSVISQSPSAGSSVIPGSTVDLGISAGPGQTAVPDVVGSTQAAAQQAITDVGLTVGTITQQNSATVPAGSVISQSPAAGSSVAPGSAVDLVVSTGPAQTAVPDVAGLTQTAAQQAIIDVGLTVGTITQQNSTTVPAGSVISQSPVAGSSVAPSSAVDLVVSTGPAQTTVPDVVGLTQTAAQQAIIDVGLTVGTITQQNSATVPAGFVISQTPVAGSSVAPGSAVDLVVSSGPAQTAVPDVVGSTQAAAQQAIIDVGLTVGTITQQNSATVSAGSIISQSPAAGSSVAPGSAVDLVVSIGPVQTAVPDVVGLTQAAAQQAIIDVGLTVGTITQQNSATVSAGSIISQSPAAGSSVAPGSAVDLVVSSGPAQTAVPNVAGLTQTAAQQTITGAGLIVGTVTQQNSSTVPAGSVISQNPGAGSTVTVGSAVNLVVSSGSPTPVTITASATQDTFVSLRDPSNNYGRNDRLVVRNTLSERRRALVRFNLAAIPAGATISSATARFFVEDASRVAINVHRVTGAWTETGATWSNIGTALETTAIGTLGPARFGQYVTVDIKTLVQRWVNGTAPNYGIMLVGTEIDDSMYSSRESSSQSRRPLLTLTYVAGGNTTTNEAADLVSGATVEVTEETTEQSAGNALYLPVIEK